MNTGRTNRLLYQMECGDIQTLDRVPDEFMFCQKCQAEVHLFAIETREWHVRCIYPRCKFGRWGGASQDLVNMAARKHSERNPSHQKFQFTFAQHPGKVDIVRSVHSIRIHRNILRDRKLPARPRKNIKLDPSLDPPPF